MFALLDLDIFKTWLDELVPHISSQTSARACRDNYVEVGLYVATVLSNLPAIGTNGRSYKVLGQWLGGVV